MSTIYPMYTFKESVKINVLSMKDETYKKHNINHHSNIPTSRSKYKKATTTWQLQNLMTKARYPFKIRIKIPSHLHPTIKRNERQFPTPHKLGVEIKFRKNYPIPKRGRDPRKSYTSFLCAVTLYVTKYLYCVWTSIAYFKDLCSTFFY